MQCFFSSIFVSATKVQHSALHIISTEVIVEKHSGEKKDFFPFKKRLIGTIKQIVKMVEKLVSGKKTHSSVIKVDKKGIRVSQTWEVRLPEQPLPGQKEPFTGKELLMQALLPPLSLFSFSFDHQAMSKQARSTSGLGVITTATDILGPWQVEKTEQIGRQ